MSINIGQIQNLLGAYHKHQVQSRLAEARMRSQDGPGEGLYEDKVVISAEAKRLQIYQRTAEEVLRRLREDTRRTLDREAHEIEAGDDDPSVGLQEP